MKDLKSRVAYLQGLSAGMDLPSDSKEGRVLNGILDVLGEMARSFEELEETQDQIEDYLESMDEDLISLEEDLYRDHDDEYMEVECPRCGEIVCFDSDVLEDDDVVEVTCPNCDEVVFINDDNYQAADEPEQLTNRRLEDEDIL